MSARRIESSKPGRDSVKLSGYSPMRRKTGTREAVLNAVKGLNRPLRPEEILEEARKFSSGIGIATVYRSIRFFLEQSQFVEVKVPGEVSRYEISGKGHHHHFHCSSCDRLVEIEGCPGNLKNLLPRGFQLENHDITLFGRCRDCR